MARETRFSPQRKTEIIDYVTERRRAGATMAEAVRELGADAPSYRLVYSWFRDRTVDANGSYASRKGRAQLANVNEVDDLLNRARTILERIDPEELEVSVGQTLLCLTLTQRWVDDLRTCTRVDHKIPDHVDFRRMAAGGIEAVRRG